MSHENIKDQVERYYSDKIAEHGSTPAGVDWNSRQSQELRFEKLLGVCSGDEKFSINDLGCGYGSLAEYLARENFNFEYYGYDLSAAMIEAARESCAQLTNCHFQADDALKPADYTVASGIFNVRGEISDEEWKNYIIATLERMNEASRRGFSFNMLTSFSDPEYMRADLYYGEPGYFFNYCKKNFARKVALLHDYELYEFTIYVRKD